MTRAAITLLLLASTAQAQVNSGGPRAAAMAGAAAALSDDLYAEQNPASLAGASSGALLVSATQLYGLRQLRLAQALVVVPVLGGTTAAAATTFGYDDYRENTASIGYAAEFKTGSVRPIAFGIRLRWYSVRINGYGAASVPTFSAGIIIPATPAISLGLAASNLYVLPLELARDVERSMHVGIVFHGTDRFAVAVDARKSTTSPADFLVGMELRPVPPIALRAGFATNPERITAGAGFRSAAVFADVAAEKHAILGWSPTVALGVEW